MSIAIEAAELMEQFQWVRSDQLGSHLESPHAQSAIRDEVADVMCYLLALANVLKLDLASAVLDKIEKNAAKYPAEQFRGRYDKIRSEK
jgi:NTP pyrophosphatase (non-canonical NTP hydrolase)